jgi:hypothetical protein
MRTLRAMLVTWQHGLAILILYALCILTAAVATSLIIFLPVIILEALGWRINEDALMLWLAIVWVPYGLGIAARLISTDKLKPEGYIEPEGRLERLSRKLKDSREIVLKKNT